MKANQTQAATRFKTLPTGKGKTDKRDQFFPYPRQGMQTAGSIHFLSGVGGGEWFARLQLFKTEYSDTLLLSMVVNGNRNHISHIDTV